MTAFFKGKYREHIAAAALWLAVFIVYLRTIATTVGFIDSGELATVTVTFSASRTRPGIPSGRWSRISFLISPLRRKRSCA